MQAIVDNLITAYKKFGSGKKIILCLPGWGDTVEGFAAMGSLSSRKYTTVLLDLPGFGGTARPKTVWGLPEYAEFVGKFVKKTDLEPYAIIGHSNGGAISVLASANGDVGPKKMVLLASSGVRNSTSPRKTLHKIGAKIVKLLIAILPKDTQNKIKKKAYNKIGSDYMAIDGLQDIFKKIVSYDVIADARKIKIPVLMVYGSNDFVTPLWQAEKIAKAIRSSRLEVIDNAEHFPHKDQPEKVKGLIEEFLK